MTEREDYDELADELDREADRLADHSEQLGEHIADVREDWERTRAERGEGPDPSGEPETPGG